MYWFLEVRNAIVGGQKQQVDTDCVDKDSEVEGVVDWGGRSLLEMSMVVNAWEDMLDACSRKVEEALQF